MHIKYNIEKLEQILTDLSVLTGISLAFLDRDMRTVCGSVRDNDFCEMMQTLPGEREKCRISDEALLRRCHDTRNFECHICRAGLYDAALPVVLNDNVVGYVIMGRVRSPDSPDVCMYPGGEAIGKLYDALPYFSDRQLLSLRTLLPNILFTDAIHFELDELAERIAQYIEENISSELTVSSICKSFFISKNRLYKCFAIYYGTTVNEYITAVRLNKAKALLAGTEEPIYTICEKIGIDNYTYFCKLFKKVENTSPGQYRKMKKTKNIL